MKNFWNNISSQHLAAKSALLLSLLAALLLSTFSTAGIASADSIPQQNLHVTATTSHTAQSHIVHPHGTNGQQIALWVGGNTGFQSVLVYGPNQYGTITANCYPSFYIPASMPTNQWNYYGGYWWSGQVILEYFGSSTCAGNLLHTTTTNVPSYEPFSDYWCVGVYNTNDPTPGGC